MESANNRDITMSLTSKQEAFCQSIADGKNQSDAYRAAYEASNMKPETVQSKASILMTNGMVRARVNELKLALSDKSQWTRLDSVIALRKVVDDADAKGAEITGAVKVLNDMHGFNAPIEVKHSGVVVTKVELVAMRGSSKD